MRDLRNVLNIRTLKLQFGPVVRPMASNFANFATLLRLHYSSKQHFNNCIPLNSKSLHLASLRIELFFKVLHYGTKSMRPFSQGKSFTKDKKPNSFSTENEEDDKFSKKSDRRESGPRSEQQTTGEDNSKQENEAPPPPHGEKSPWQVFTETLHSEFKASKEWNESTKALAAGAQQFSENESVRKAREAYEATTGAVGSTTAKVLKKTAGAVEKGASWTWETSVLKGVRTTVNATANVIEKGTRPLRETEAFKNVKNVIDDGSSSRYGGWVEKEERRQRRVAREAANATEAGNENLTKDNPKAGTNLTVHKDAAWRESWREFRDTNKMMQSLFSIKSAYNQSDNPLISTVRNISDRVAGFFAENETAIVIKKIREMDPKFQMEPFVQEMREYILPEVLDAYIKGDIETLRLWLSAAQFQVYYTLSKQYTTAGLRSDGRILDIRNVEVLSARILEPGDVPIFIITCRTQEVHVYRNLKTNELAAGMEDRVQLVTYAIGVTRIQEDIKNPETRGWRLIELQKSGRDYI